MTTERDLKNQLAFAEAKGEAKAQKETSVRDFGRFPGREREKRASIHEKGVFSRMEKSICGHNL